MEYYEIGIVLLVFVGILWWMNRRYHKALDRQKEDYEQEIVKWQQRINEEYTVQVSDKQAKIAALQSQINPHFLYNTLECIRSEALLYECQSIADMAKALAAFFRYSISKKENIVTVRDELRNIENYFMIQSYRFENKFSFDIKVSQEDEEVYNYQVPKLSLQPIVENAIFHGLETKVADGKVTIRAYTTDKELVMVISDNGVGIAPDTLLQMQKALRAQGQLEMHKSSEHGNGIALYNVNQRIRLLFGETYGLHIYSTKGMGTDVEIWLPKVENGYETGSN